MRIFAVPGALLLACCLYLPLPRAKDALYAALRHLYAYVQRRLFTRKGGRADEKPALLAYLLALCGALLLLCAIHPLVSMALMAPAFTGLCVLPGCARVKDALDSGKYARDIPAYEALVRETCAQLAPACAQGVVAPLMLGCAGMPLHMGPALCAAYTALCALAPDHLLAARIADRIQRFADRALLAFMVLCAGVVGRNPLHTRGADSQSRLMDVLRLTDGHAEHAPMAGDIPQGVFLCGFAALVLCFTGTAIGFVLCR